MGMTKSLFTELSCEEEFELNAWCDERREADIAAQDRDMVDEELARQSDAQLAEDAALDLMIAAGWSGTVPNHPAKAGFFIFYFLGFWSRKSLIVKDLGPRAYPAVRKWLIVNDLRVFLLIFLKK